MMQQIALTGGSGFIGRFITELCLAAEGDYRIRNLDLVTPGFSSSSEFIQGDVRDATATDRLCNGASAVIHLAAAHRDVGISRQEYFDVNERGTEVLLTSMTKHDVNHLIFYSSVAVYDAAATAPINESTVPNPQNPYGESKYAAEQRIEHWIAQEPTRSALFIRPTVVIGPRNIANMYALIDQISRGRYKFHFGTGKNIKSLAIVMNLAEFTLWSIEQQFVKPGSMQIVNFIDRPQMQVQRTIDVIHEELERPLPKLTVPLSLAMSGGYAFDLIAKVSGKSLPISSARIKKLTTATCFDADRYWTSGFKPRFDTEDGLRQMTRWYRDSQAGRNEIPVSWLAPAGTRVLS